MRGESTRQGQLFSYVSLDARIPKTHPLRRFKQLCEATLKRLGPMFDVIYSGIDQPSIPPERLLRADRACGYLCQA